ncbi:hypothetical protein ES705_10350 [subsurface metagenome]
MTNWVVRIETAMKNSPSPEVIAREVEASGGKVSPVDLWLKKEEEALKRKGKARR